MSNDNDSDRSSRSASRAIAIVAGVTAAALALSLPDCRTGGRVANADDGAPRGVLYTARTTVSTTSAPGGAATPITGLAGAVTLPETRCLRVTVTTRIVTTEAPVSADVLIRYTTIGDAISSYTAGQTHRLDASGGPGGHSFHVEHVGEYPVGERRFAAVVRKTVGGSSATVVATGQPQGADFGPHMPAQELTIEDLGPSCHRAPSST